MKALIQRVRRASVTVDAQCVGTIEQGILAYIGLGPDDDLTSAQRMVDKILTYRIFDNDDDPAKYGKLDKNVQQVGGGLLLVSQFTLMAKQTRVVALTLVVRWHLMRRKRCLRNWSPTPTRNIQTWQLVSLALICKCRASMTGH